MKGQGPRIDRQRVNRLAEASDWLLRLQAPGRTEAEYDDWLRWCDADPENFAAFETVQRKWKDLDALKVPQLSHPGRQFRRSSHAVRWAAAAAIVAMALTVGVTQYARKESTAAPQQLAAAYANHAATLPDGSKMVLGAQSRVNMDFDEANRRIDLASGEAYFKVKHDEARPFIVQAGAVSVRAIGTAFDVRRNPGKVTVTVEEGTVEVRGSTLGDEDAVWRAEAGYQLIYSTRHRTASLVSVNPSAALGWRNGELAYIHEPLGSVVEDLNRYSTRKIVIVDAELTEIPFTGTAFAPSLDGWLAAVEQAYPIDVSESSTGEIVLSARR